MPEGGQRLGSATRSRWSEPVQRSHRRILPGAPAPAAGDGQYAHARNRRLLSQKALAPWLWRGRSVKLVDGTGISMPDTPENQALYPQPNTQRPEWVFLWRDLSW